MVENLKLKKIIIAAIAKNGIIGKKGKIPWSSKEELKHFRETTLGHPIIFGRITFDSINKPLDKRLNIVISKSRISSLSKQNVLYFESIKKAYSYLRKNNYEKVYICGGKSIYKAAVRNSDEMIISEMNFESKGDTKFPKININNWKLTKVEEFLDFKVYYYIRQMI